MGERTTEVKSHFHLNIAGEGDRLPGVSLALGVNLEGLAEAGFLHYKVFISLPLGTVALCTRAEHPFRFLCIFANIFVLVVLVLFYFLGV